MSSETNNVASRAAVLAHNVVDLIPLGTASAGHGGTGEEGAWDLIDHAAELIRTSTQRALHAEDKADKVAAKAMEAVRAAELRVEQGLAQARMIEQHARDQAKLAEERVAKAEAMAEERIAKAEACAQEAEERARAAENRLSVAEARAEDAEQRFEHLNEALRRKLSSVVVGPSPISKASRSLN